MGEYEESTDLSFIAAKYREYLDSPESLYSTGELGIIYHDSEHSLYDGSELGIVVGKTIHGDHLELVPFMAEKEIVHETVKQIREYFPEFRYIPANDIEDILYPEKMTTEQLATALADIAKDYNPYEYFDTIEPGEDIVDTIMMDLKVGGAYQYISYLKDIVEDECEYSQKAGVLIERLKSYSFDELKEMEPVAHVEFCEKVELAEKKYQTLEELDQKVQELDAQLSVNQDEKTGQAKKLVMMYFTLYYPGNEKVEKMKGKICIGDGHGGIVSHLKMDIEMKLTDESWIRYQKGRGEEAYSAYLADMTNLQENVLPYLQQFVALEEQHPITSKEPVVVDQDAAKKKAGVKKEQNVNADKLSIHERLARNKEKIQMQSARNGKDNGIEIG